MMGPRRDAGGRLRGARPGIVISALLALGGCKGEPAPTTDAAPTEEGAPTLAPVEAPAGPPKDAASACKGQLGALLEEPIEVPEDLRIAARIDLRDGSLAAALGALEAWARSGPEGAAEEAVDGSDPGGGLDAAGSASDVAEPAPRPGEASTEEPGAGEGASRSGAGVRPPTVAGLALSQIGFQVAHIRRLLGELGIDPPEMLLLQGPDGELVWLWRLPCDHEQLRALVRSGWDLRIRTLVAGALGEPVDPKRFPFDLLFLPGDRLALVPAGDGLKLLRWLTGGGPRVPGLGAPQVEEEGPAELLATLAPAAIRMVLADRVGGALTLRPASKATGTLRIRAGAEGLEISDSLPAPL